MPTYAFTNEHGLSPSDVQSALAALGFGNCGFQILHYARPRIVLITTDREWTASESRQVQDAIAAIHGTDPAPPPN